jgi:undecaprenyl-diphosphatase
MTRNPPTSSLARRGSLLGVGAVLLAIVLLMLFVDPVVGRWASKVSGSGWVETFRTLVRPLGRDALQGLFILALLIAALVSRSWAYARLALIVGLAYAISGATCHLIKMAVHRPRPEVMSVPWSGGWGLEACLLENELHSFPSGDVTIAAALATVLFLAIGRGRWRYTLLLIPLLSAVGRVVVAAHYPSDCLVGALLGAAVALLVWRWLMPRPAPMAPSGETPAE